MAAVHQQEFFPREATEPMPGAHHLPNWLDVAAQVELVGNLRRWVGPDASPRYPVVPGRGQMSVAIACLGWHWLPYRYSKTVDDVDGAPVARFPDQLTALAIKAVDAAYGDSEAGRDPFTPDVALINHYRAGSKMGMHQDNEERIDQPVVSISLGDTCTFRFGNTHARTKPYVDIELRSGDLFVFGGDARRAFHGVPKVHPRTAPAALGLDGRINITIRQTGLPSR